MTTRKDPIFEVTLVQHLVQYLLMSPALASFSIGWEQPFGRQHVDIYLHDARRKTVLVECKDYNPADINRDARKIQSIITSYGAQMRSPTGYVLALWRNSGTEVDVRSVAAKSLARRGNGLDSKLVKLVSSKSFDIFDPDRRQPFAVGLFKVL